jgi:hypothetical protein
MAEQLVVWSLAHSGRARKAVEKTKQDILAPAGRTEDLVTRSQSRSRDEGDLSAARSSS